MNLMPPELRSLIPLLEVSPWRAIRAVLAGTVALGCSVALAAVSAWLIARASQMPPVLTLSVAVVAVRAFGVGRGIFRYLERLCSHDVALRGMASLRANLYDAIARGPITGIASLKRGDLLTRVGTDVDEVGNLVVRGLVPVGVAALVGTGSVILVGSLLPLAGLGLFGCLVLTGIVSPVLSARGSAQTEVRAASARSEVTARVLGILEDGQQLRVSGQLPREIARLQRADAALTAAGHEGARTSGIAAGISAGAQTLAVIAALALGAVAVQNGSLLDVHLAVVVLTPLAVFEATSTLPDAAIQWRRSRESARRIAELLDAGSEARDGQNTEASWFRDVRTANSGAHEQSHLTASGVSTLRQAQDNADGHSVAWLNRPVRDEWPTTPVVEPASNASDGRNHLQFGTTLLELREVSAGWPGGDAVCQSVNLTLTSGDAVALVGPSGAGKTTLLMTAAGLLPPLAGTVTYGSTTGGGPPNEGTLFAAEDGHIFHTTVLENLRVARADLTANEARKALSAVDLITWPEALPEGLNTMLGTDGATVSGGERRRLLIARALLSPARVLLVDEPAEHLDGDTADHVIEALITHARTTNRAVVYATHRPAEAARADRTLSIN
ncbi:MAG: thiol reductant ABC exporter subunit CydC [Cellulomonadaceae bacterium]|jgi:ATP-binding cassette subfamily C protein CydC|nr:thiol reductant ABC exporter subunit CydC [Cellulomonadaceae bacterium]